MNKKRVGLFFGSFNPIHNGHMILANYIVEFTDLHELWFVVSPQNPLKEKKSLLDDHHRLDMVFKAVNDDPRFSVNDIEFRMPRPSFTIDTLTRLSERHPNTEFSLICGMDNLESMPKWKNYEMLLNTYRLLVYPRKGHDGGKYAQHPSVQHVNAPEIEISSSFIRRAVASGKNLSFFMPDGAFRYMTEMHFYE
ncbi:MAG: nicotinate-nucleotide adenylyltransferase [Bacteroidetes bacterium]|nr:nicotinate-nucleotide adenylyltransferase [Bacteroidota bacterium]MBU1581043.1 nicotinate-nucleotide adenylyltransferase [Bacteroidota bacterium]MBU2558310.1 nicotinate-nucleotide adenylyltransferase [Bacteroidota bacterium]